MKIVVVSIKYTIWERISNGNKRTYATYQVAKNSQGIDFEKYQGGFVFAGLHFFHLNSTSTSFCEDMEQRIHTYKIQAVVFGSVCDFNGVS
jgi:hypothetical protein